MGDALWERSALELAGSIRKGEVSSREVVSAHLARIEEVNPRLNAVTVVLFEEALAAADAVDAGGGEGPLRGVPISVKENIDCAGTATTNGVPALADAVAPIDAPSVERLRAAGAIPIARTNLPEMALRISTDNPLRGLTRNPWHQDLTAGGSSGGEGSAIASGMSPLGLGNDIGGSVRNPAFCCGITSLKPTPGRIPQATVIPPEDPGLAVQLMAVCGPMARHVADLRVAFELLAGHHPRDPVSVTVPLEGPAPRQRRAALVTGIDGVDSPPEIAEAVRRAGAALADAGWEVVEAAPPELDRVHEVWAHVLAFDLMAMLDMIRPLMTESAVALLEGLIDAYPVESMPPQLAHVERHRLSSAWTAFFADHPVIVGPGWTLPPFTHGEDIDPVHGATNTLDRLRFITPGNVLGLPSVAVPTGTADGHPTGVQVYADRWREDLCLAAAETVESALGRITPIDPTWG